MGVRQLREYVALHWQELAIYGGLFAVFALALGWQLNSLVPGYSSGELATYQASVSLRGMLDNPLNAPFLLAVKGLSYLHPDSLLVVRIVSALGGLGVLVLFAALLRRWHDGRTAVLGTLLFGLSAWFLHTARLGTPDVLLFGVFVLAVCGYWLKQTGSWFALAACFLLGAAALYIPGMVWFVALGIIWQWKTLDRIFKKRLVTVTFGGLVWLAALVPLGWAIYRNHSLIKPWLGLPADWPTPFEMLRNLLEVPFHLFVRNSADPATWLGTAPILDVFTLTMFVLGGYIYLRHGRLARTPLFIAILVLTVLLMALGGSVTFTAVMPFVYLGVAAGMAYLFDLWFIVFPRNPIARGIGWGLIGIVIALVCVFHLTHYFVGWPQATATHQTFTIQKP